jgi:hypothetical protein
MAAPQPGAQAIRVRGRDNTMSDMMPTTRDSFKVLSCP